eukprot:6323801-Amphidinium_carterae.1
MASGAVVALYTAPDAPLPLKLPTFFYRLGIVGLFFCLASVVIIGLMNLVRAFVCSTPLVESTIAAPRQDWWQQASAVPNCKRPYHSL